MDLSASVLDCLARHADQRPDAQAVENFGAKITWRKFHDDAGRFVQALQEIGLRPGQIAAVEHPDPYLHWLLLVALEALGAVSASFLDSERDDLDQLGDLLDRSDIVLGRHDWNRQSQHLLNDGWLRSVLGRDARPSSGVAAMAEDWVRLNRSSGTTRRPKLMLMRKRMQDYWIAHVQEIEGYSPSSRLLVAYPFAVNAVYARATANLRRGGLTIFGPAPRILEGQDVTHLWLLPGLLKDVLSQLSPDAPQRPELRLTTGGGAVSGDLREQVRQRLGCEILSGYGANEAGTAICRIDPDGVGRPYPGVSLRIVDESGCEAQSGEIELRTPGLVEGYLGQQAQTRDSFKDGWFRTGDLGERLDGDRFCLLGRRDEALNFGGVKISAPALEEKILRQVPELADIAVLSIPDRTGEARMHIAAVLGPGCRLAALIPKLALAVPKAAGEVKIKAVPVLPRTANGKLRRAEAAAIFLEKKGE
ncbi:MAG: class I adenylate-forming enzyme family protein [Rhodospirillales bacterium]